MCRLPGTNLPARCLSCFHFEGDFEGGDARIEKSQRINTKVEGEPIVDKVVGEPQVKPARPLRKNYQCWGRGFSFLPTQSFILR